MICIVLVLMQFFSPPAQQWHASSPTSVSDYTPSGSADTDTSDTVSTQLSDILEAAAAATPSDQNNDVVITFQECQLKPKVRQTRGDKS
mgnify:CR=1 FL=1